MDTKQQYNTFLSNFANCCNEPLVSAAFYGQNDVEHEGRKRNADFYYTTVRFYELKVQTSNLNIKDQLDRWRLSPFNSRVDRVDEQKFIFTAFNFLWLTKYKCVDCDLFFDFDYCVV